MSQSPSRFFLPMLLLIIALPAVATLVYFNLSGDPTFRPLGITVASLTQNRTGGTSRGITVQIDWGENASSPNTRQQVEQALKKALAIYTVDFVIRFRDTASDEIQINFLIDNRSVGPYRLQNVSSGIPVALAAHNLANRAAP